MHFSHLHPDGGAKAGKFALVAALHALIAVGVVNMMNHKAISLPALPLDLTVLLTPEPVAPPEPPPEPPMPVPRVAAPQIVVPIVEVEVPPPAVDNPLQATTVEVPAPREPARPMQTEVPARPATPATPATTGGALRSAVLADANACVKPNYPLNAVRNGESGTVTLALLVGTDGRVTSARIQKSSGSRDLDRAAMSALSLCQFKPATNNGVPEAGWGQIAYVWTLD